MCIFLLQRNLRLKSSFIQPNTLLKGSFQSITKWGNYDYLEFISTLITLEGKLSTAYVTSYSINTELIS